MIKETIETKNNCQKEREKFEKREIKNKDSVRKKTELKKANIAIK